MKSNYPHFKNPRPLLTAWLVEALTGSISSTAFPFVGSSRDGRWIEVCFDPARSSDRFQSFPCPPDARPLLRELTDLIERLEREGTDGASVIIDIDSDGKLLVRPRTDPAAKRRIRDLDLDDPNLVRLPDRLRPQDPMEPDPQPETLECDLKHGIRLRATTAGDLRIGADAIVDFLTVTLNRLRQSPAALQGEALRARSYSKKVTRGGFEYGTIRLASLRPITRAQWVESAIDAIARVSTVKDIVQDFPVWRKAAAASEGDALLRELVASLEKTECEFAAIKLVLARPAR